MLSRYRLRASVLALNFLLIAQAAGVYAFSRKEAAPAAIPLNDLPQQIGDWHGIEDVTLDPESNRILRPDDYIIRNYQSGSQAELANLFIAYFRSQRTDRTPHSPQNCLPGNGWTWTAKETVPLAVPDSPAPIYVNLMLVTRGDDRSIVVYWYQTPTRVIANEYMARAQLMLDSIRHNRSDTALVRIVVPIVSETDEGAVRELALQFAHAVQPIIRQYIPLL